MFAVVDERAQAGEGPFLVFGLVACLGTLDEDFLRHARVRVAPVVAQAHARLHFVYILPTGTAASERVPLDFPFVDFDVEGFGLGQYGHRGGRRVHAPLCLRGRHTLYAMYPRLVFHRAVDLFARYGTDDFLVAAGSSLCETGYFHPPAFAFAILGIHAEEVSREDGRLVAAGAGTYLKDGVAVILRVGGSEQELDLFFNLRYALLTDECFLPGHLLHLRVGLGHKDLLGFVQRSETLDIFFPCVHQVPQLLVFLRQLHIAFLVCDDGRVGNQRGDFFKTGDEVVELFQ